MFPARNESSAQKNLTACYSMTCGRPRSDNWRRPWQLQDGYFEPQPTLNRVSGENKMEACTRNCADDATDDTVELMCRIARPMNRQPNYWALLLITGTVSHAQCAESWPDCGDPRSRDVIPQRRYDILACPCARATFFSTVLLHEVAIHRHGAKTSVHLPDVQRNFLAALEPKSHIPPSLNHWARQCLANSTTQKLSF